MRADRTDTYGTSPRPGDGPIDMTPETDGAYVEQAGAYGTPAPQPAAAHDMPASVPAAETPEDMPAADGDGDIGAVLFGGGDVERFRARWRELQADFVDDPMAAVRGADGLVDEVMRSLSEVVAAHKHDLESEWQAGDTGETENLRVALRHYRAFFDQLLTA